MEVNRLLIAAIRDGGAVGNIDGAPLEQAGAWWRDRPDQRPALIAYTQGAG